MILKDLSPEMKKGGERGTLVNCGIKSLLGNARATIFTLIKA